MAFFEVRKKTVSGQQLRAFWENWKTGKKTGKRICPVVWKRKVIAVTPTVLGTVRRFNSIKELQEYKKITGLIENAVVEFKPKTFELQKVQFFGQNGTNLLERVYRTPNLSDLSSERKDNRYFLSFLRRLKIKADIEKIKDALASDSYQTLKELERFAMWLIEKKGVLFDFAGSNFLALDYDPEKRKFLIAIIDHGGSIRE